MDSIARDIRHGLRRVLATPGSTAIAILTLALGIGANVPIFTVVNAVVISDGLWRRAFGASPGVIGRKVIMDTDTYTVVGVMPPDFRHPGETVRGDVDMWSACGFTAAPFPNPPQRQQNFIPGAMGRL